MKDYGIRFLIAAVFMAAAACLIKGTVLGYVFYGLLFMSGWILLWVYGEPRRKWEKE